MRSKVSLARHRVMRRARHPHRPACRRTARPSHGPEHGSYSPSPPSSHNTHRHHTPVSRRAAGHPSQEPTAVHAPSTISCPLSRGFRLADTMRRKRRQVGEGRRAPIFVDFTGRRLRVIRLAAVMLGSAALLAVALLAFGIGMNPNLSVPGFPHVILGQHQQARPTPTAPPENHTAHTTSPTTPRHDSGGTGSGTTGAGTPVSATAPVPTANPAVPPTPLPAPTPSAAPTHGRSGSAPSPTARPTPPPHP